MSAARIRVSICQRSAYVSSPHTCAARPTPAAGVGLGGSCYAAGVGLGFRCAAYAAAAVPPIRQHTSLGGTAAAAYALGFRFAAGVGLDMQLVWGLPHTYAGADIRWRMLMYGGHCSYSIRMRVLTYADVCWRMLTYAEHCSCSKRASSARSSASGGTGAGLAAYVSVC